MVNVILKMIVLEVMVFQPIYRYFKKNCSSHQISAWISKGLSDESINLPATSDNSLAPSLNCIGTETRVKFDGSCLKQDKITFANGKAVTICNVYVVYEMNLWDRGYGDYSPQGNSLFGAVKLVKNNDINKYKYSGYNIGFDRRGTFSVVNGFSKNIIIFGVDMSS